MMAAVSNLWITPPSFKTDESAFADIRRALVLKREKTTNARSPIHTKWFSSLRKFHHNRLLEFAQVKAGVGLTFGLIEQTLRDVIPFLEIKHLTLNKSTGSVRIIPEYAEAVDPLLNPWQAPPITGNHLVKIRLSNTEDFLCVCNLPSHITEEKFKTYVEKFGSVERSFLIYDDLTDTHKGYGLVEYSSRAVACQAKNLLHKNTLDSQVLFCDWLDHKVVTYSGLYSKCLYIECLPAHFKDLGCLRELFSVYFSPVYCQIGLKNGRNFALVEYDSHESANITREKLDGCWISKSNIQVHFAVPGRSAVQLYNNFVMESLQETKRSDGLLPTPRSRLALLPLPGIPNLFKPQQVSHMLNVPLLQNHLHCLPKVPLMRNFNPVSQLQELAQAQEKQKLISEIHHRMLTAQRMLEKCSQRMLAKCSQVPKQVDIKVENAKDNVDCDEQLKEKENHQEKRLWTNKTRGLLQTPPTGHLLLDSNLKRNSAHSDLHWKSSPEWTPTKNAEKVPNESIWKVKSPEGLLPVPEVNFQGENSIGPNRKKKRSLSKTGILGNAICEGAGLLQMDLENSPTKMPLLSEQPLLSDCPRTPLLSLKTKKPLISGQTKSPLLSPQTKKPLLRTKKPLIENKPPLLSDHPQTPLLSDNPNMPLLSNQLKKPLLSEHSKTPLILDHPKTPLLSDYNKVPLLSDRPKPPLLVDHQKTPLLSDHPPKQPLLLDHQKTPLLPDHPKPPLLVDHQKTPLLSDHPPKQPLLLDHQKTPLLPDHPKPPLLVDHPKTPLLSDHPPKQPLFLDHQKTPLLPDHPKPPLLLDHQKTPLLSDHTKPPLLSDHPPKPPLLLDHRKTLLLSDHSPRPPLLLDHQKTPLLCDHPPKPPLFSERQKTPLLSDHPPKPPLLSEHQKTPLLSDHPPKPLLSDHQKTPLLSDYPLKAPLLLDHQKTPLLLDPPSKPPLLLDHQRTPLLSDHPSMGSR